MFTLLLYLLTVPPPSPAPPPEPKEVPAKVKEIDELTVNDDTEVLIDGKPAALDDVTDKHEIVDVIFDPDTRIILRVKFRTKR